MAEMSALRLAVMANGQDQTIRAISKRARLGPVEYRVAETDI